MMIYQSSHLKTLISQRPEPCMETNARSARRRAINAACANMLLSANGCWHFIDNGISPKSHTNAEFAMYDSTHEVNASCIFRSMQKHNDFVDPAILIVHSVTIIVFQKLYFLELVAHQQIDSISVFIELHRNWFLAEILWKENSTNFITK